MPFGFGGGGGRGHGHGMGRGRGRNFGMMESDANCVCPQCNTIAPHQRGVPCFQTICPRCGAAMTRQFNAVASTQQPQSFSSTPQQQSFVPVVDQALCTGCQRCVAVCPFGAIEIVDKKAVIQADSCNNCRVCVSSCPESAIH
jgi:Pyruvate/2-oxoacid:ferredoxin oxidoreductase delta subunit